MARKRVATAQEANQRWTQAMAQAGAAYTAGVQAVSVAPTAAAATPEAMAAYQQGVAQSVASGKRAASLQAVSLQQWQQASVQKGAQRLGTGAQASAQKQLAAAQKLQPVWQQMRDAAASVTGPKGMSTAMAKWQASMQVMYNAVGKQG